MRNMRITVTLLTLFQSALLFSQTADITTGCAPLTVKFTPPAGATGFFWDFKDGASSALANPSNLFSTPGTYDVEFRQSQGGPVEGTVKITVFPKPEIGITAVPESGCVPLTVNFSDTTQLAGDIQIQKYNWVFGDGMSGAGAMPSHTYTNVGAYTVSLQLTTNYSTCNVTKVFTEKIKTGIKPVVGFTTAPSPAIACQPPLLVNFTNTTIGGSGSLTYSWDLGNGNVSTLVNPPAQNYTQIGSFKVTLTATDDIGCSATATSTVIIGNPPADFSVADTVCVGQAVKFTNNSAFGNYTWNFGPNATPATSTQASPQVTFNAPGFQTVTLVVSSSGGCSSTANKQILIEQADASFTVAPVYSCGDPTVFTLNATSPGATQWSWSFGNGTTDSLKSTAYTWVTPDTTGYTSRGLFLDTIWLEVRTPSGCVDRTFRVDSIWRPNARMVPDKQHGCIPLTVVFADSSISNEPIVQWTWLFDDGTPPVVNNNNAPVTHTFTKEGEFKVRLIIRNSAGCIDTSYINLIEAGSPIAGDFTADKFEVCPGDTVQFINLTNDPRVDGWHFSSEDDRVWHCFHDDKPYWVYNSATGPMSVSLTTEYNGCFFTVTKSDLVLAKGPIAQLHYKTTCDSTLKFAFTDESHDATKLTWYLGDGDSTVQSAFTHLYKQPGTYTVVLKAENPASGCPISYDTATVYPTVLKAVFDLPDTICGGEMQLLDGTKSTSVNAACYKGYTWYFDFNRPIRTDSSSIQQLFGPSGEHSVCLEVEDINGCRDTLCDTVMIYNRMPEFTVSDDSICIPATVSFTDNSTADATIVKWEWDFGDGTMSTDVNPVHTYASPPPNGTSFTVTLRIEDDKECPAYFSKEIFVYKPFSNILTVPSPPNICDGKTVNFVATNFTAGGSSLSWQWNFGNGNTGTGQAPPPQTYTGEGQYQVKLDFTEIATGCKGSTSIPVNVQNYPLANFTSSEDGSSIICHPVNISFSNASTGSNFIDSLFWDFGNGVTTKGPAVIPASVGYTKGTYTVTMIAKTTYGCRDTVSRTFDVVGPTGTFTPDKDRICYGDEVTFTLNNDTSSVNSWTWFFGDGDKAEGGNPVKHTYKPNFKPSSGYTVVELQLKTANDACQFIDSAFIFFSQVNADFTTQTPTVCLGLPYQFVNNSSSATFYEWNFGDGTTDGQVNPSHTYAAQGTYPVTLIATDGSAGCMDTIVKQVTVTGIPNLETFGATVCPGDTAMIGVENPPFNGTYVWTPTSLVLIPKDEPIVNVVVTQTTDFIVSVTDGQGCMDVDTARVTVPEPFNGAMDFDTIVAKGDKVLLPVSLDPNYTFEWIPSPGPQGNPPEVTAPDTSVLYTLIVRDKQQCTEREFKFNIRVVPEKVYAPNAFTPGNDDANETFHLQAVGDEGLVDVLSLKIYNRWGQKIFDKSGSLTDVAWDGRIDGKEAPTDVYVWVAEVQFATGRRVSLKGDITLLR